MRSGGEDGYVLAAALAALLAMSIVAAALVSVSASELRRVATAERAAADDAALAGAITLAAAQLADEPRRRSLPFEGGRAEVAVAGRTIELRAAWESDKLDLNAAPPGVVDARLAAAGLDGADRAAIRRALEVKRAGGDPVRLVDDVLAEVSDPECARAVLTVFGGRSDWTEAADGETIAIGRPAPGSRVVVTATLAAGPGARGREAVLLFTGDPRAPARVMDERPVRGSTGPDGRNGEGCHAA